MTDEQRRQKVLELVEEGKRELREYRQKEQFVTLAQASEKAWRAFIALMELKSGEDITGEVRPFAKRFEMMELYYRCHELHIFHYHGGVAFDWLEITNDLEEVFPQIRREAGG